MYNTYQISNDSNSVYSPYNTENTTTTGYNVLNHCSTTK